MADELLELRHEAEEASDSLWFIGALEEIERTDITLSTRLHIRPRLFVQVFLGTKSDSLDSGQGSLWASTCPTLLALSSARRPSEPARLLTKVMPKNKQPQSHGNIRQLPGGYPWGVVPFLRALVAPDADALVAWAVEAGPKAGWVAWLRGQSLAPFVFYRLREADVLARLPADVQRGLQGAYYAAAGINAVQRRETEAVLRALASAGVETVLMKGTPLAYTVYAEPACRLKGDLDIWLPPAQFPVAMEALRPLGYAPRDKSDRPAAFISLTGGEQQLIGRDPGTGLVELQWPALRGEWVRRAAAVDHAAIWARRVAVPIEGRSTGAMAPEDLLIHLCLHLAINHGFGELALRNLLDVHLVAVRLSPDWDAVVDRARAWRLATMLWTTLSLAVQLWGAPVPASVLAALRPNPARGAPSQRSIWRIACWRCARPAMATGVSWCRHC